MADPGFPASLTPSAAGREALPPMPPTTTFDAIVQQAVGRDTFVLKAMGRLIEVVSELPLVVGARISLRREGDLLRLMPATPPDDGNSPGAEARGRPGEGGVRAGDRNPDALLSRLGLPATEGRRAVARAMMDHGVPPTVERFAAIERFASRGAPAAVPARLEAAAALSARGVTDLDVAAEPLARALAVPWRLAEALTRLDSALRVEGTAQPARVELGVTSPAETLARGGVSPEALARLEGKLRAAVQRTLAADPLLRALDAVLTRLAGERPAGAAETGAGGGRLVPPGGPAILPAEVRVAIEALLARPEPGATNALADRLALLNPSARTAAVAFLVEREQDAVDRLPALPALRQGLAALQDASDRSVAYRAVNLLSAARADGTYVFEIPLVLHGQAFAVALKVRRDERGARTGSTGAPASVFVRVDLTRIGLVTCAVCVQGKRAEVAFRVRDEEVRKRFAEGRALLHDALAALGLTPQLAVSVREDGSDEWADWLIGPEGPVASGIDLQA